MKSINLSSFFYDYKTRLNYYEVFKFNHEKSKKKCLNNYKKNGNTMKS